ncbi:MAG: hypothetical protein A2Y24_07450 [Clostridiales bacterium GWE2_32_10]|nr:MAG: hypothetical protein A2Y24_07450 [Clostridiales bacterium GWE2_32_10]HBY20425.1 transcriptional regulator [Clostridiales bacterium]
MLTREELKVIIEEGEGYKIEFKESADKTLAEEVCAFLNASGGLLLLGISDNGMIKGIDVSNVNRSRVQDTLRQIEPSVNLNVEIQENLILIRVPEGKSKPYSCSKGFYLRVGPNSQKLERNEIIEFIQAEGKVRFDEQVSIEIEVDKELDEKTYKRFLKLAKITDALPAELMLKNLGCAIDKNGKTIFTNAGLLFFIKDYDYYVMQGKVVCALYKGNEKLYIIDKKDFSNNLISAIDDTMAFLEKHLNLRYEINNENIIRKEILEIPQVALKEVVTNAICHRDYFEKGTNVMIEIFDDRVEITNSGGLPKGLPESKFGTMSVPRNPIIANILHRAEYIEKMGTGIHRIKTACTLAGLLEPEFEISDSYFIVRFIRERGWSGKASVYEKEEEIKFSKTQLKILELIKGNRELTAEKISKELDLSERQVQTNMSTLKKLGVLKRNGNKRSGYWEVDI